MAEKEVKETTKIVRFMKEQLKCAKEFIPFKDIIEAAVKADEKLTKAECKKKIDTFLKKEVK
jgi:hypothetical protein